MQTFRCYDENLRHLSCLFLPFIYLRISVPDSYLPLHSQICNNFFHGTANILGQCTKRGNPEQPEMITGFRLIVFRMLINELDDGAKKNRKRFSASCGSIHEPGM